MSVAPIPSTHAAIPLRDNAFLVLIAVIWGLNSVLTKVALDYVPPLFLTVVRFSITLVLLAPFVRPIGPMWKPLFVVCLLTGPIHFGIQFLGLKLATDLSPMVIAMQLWIPATVGLAAVFLKERVAPMRVLGMTVSFAGIVVLAFEPSVLVQMHAFTLVAIAAVAYGAATVMMRKFGGLDPVQTQAWLALLTIPSLGLLSLGTEQGQIQSLLTAPPIVWFALVFASLLSGIVANVGMWQLIQRYEVSRTTPFTLLTPVIAVALGIVLLGDPLSPQLFIGALLVLGGVAVVALIKN